MSKHTQQFEQEKKTNILLKNKHIGKQGTRLQDKEPTTSLMGTASKKPLKGEHETQSSLH